MVELVFSNTGLVSKSFFCIIDALRHLYCSRVSRDLALSLCQAGCDGVLLFLCAKEFE